MKVTLIMLAVACGLSVAEIRVTAQVAATPTTRQNSTAAAKVANPKTIPSGAYRIDPAHSSINFAIQHQTINLVRGRFTDFNGTININDQDATKSSVEFTAKIASINTDVAARDEHLRSADFFEAAKFPEMSFKSTRVEQRGKEFVAHGDFTLKGVTKRIAIPFVLSNPIQDARGTVKFGVQARTKINRQDYGISWNRPMENGGLSLGNEVDIELLLEAVKREAQPN